MYLSSTAYAPNTKPISSKDSLFAFDAVLIQLLMCEIRGLQLSVFHH